MKNKIVRFLLPSFMAIMSMGCFSMDVPISHPQATSLLITISNQTGHQLRIEEMILGFNKNTEMGNLAEMRISLLPHLYIKPNGMIEEVHGRFAIIHSNNGTFELLVNNYAGSLELVITELNTQQKVVIANPRRPILIFEPDRTMPTVQELE